MLLSSNHVIIGNSLSRFYILYQKLSTSLIFELKYLTLCLQSTLGWNFVNLAKKTKPESQNIRILTSTIFSTNKLNMMQSFYYLSICFFCLFASRALGQQNSNLILYSDIFYFASGSSKLSPKNQKNVGEVVQLLINNPLASVSIAAHTDSIGADQFNDELAAARASAIQQALQKNNITADRININSYGEYAPPASNATERGRAQNRRVTVNVLNPFEPKTETAAINFEIKGQVRNAHSKDVIANAVVILDYVGQRDTIVTDAEGRYQSTLAAAEIVNITVNAKRFFFQNKQTAVVARTPAIVDFELAPAMIGNKLQLGGLYFQGGTAVLLPNSEKTLTDIVTFLKQNEDLKVELGGHINKPNQAMVEEGSSSFLLSQNRAKSVYNYLLSQGVDESQISYQGYGNWQMLYPETTNPAEQQANRRVELKIVKQ